MQGPRLEGRKITGDRNVPAGKFSVVADSDAATPGRYDGAEADAGEASRPIGALPPLCRRFRLCLIH